MPTGKGFELITVGFFDRRLARSVSERLRLSLLRLIVKTL